MMRMRMLTNEVNTALAVKRHQPLELADSDGTHMSDSLWPDLGSDDQILSTGSCSGMLDGKGSTLNLNVEMPMGMLPTKKTRVLQ